MCNDFQVKKKVLFGGSVTHRLIAQYQSHIWRIFDRIMLQSLLQQQQQHLRSLFTVC